MPPHPLRSFPTPPILYYLLLSFTVSSFPASHCFIVCFLSIPFLPSPLLPHLLFPSLPFPCLSFSFLCLSLSTFSFISQPPVSFPALAFPTPTYPSMPPSFLLYLLSLSSPFISFHTPAFAPSFIFISYPACPSLPPLSFHSFFYFFFSFRRLRPFLFCLPIPFLSCPHPSFSTSLFPSRPASSLLCPLISFPAYPFLSYPFLPPPFLFLPTPFLPYFLISFSSEQI